MGITIKKDKIYEEELSVASDLTMYSLTRAISKLPEVDGSMLNLRCASQNLNTAFPLCHVFGDIGIYINADYAPDEWSIESLRWVKDRFVIHRIHSEGA